MYDIESDDLSNVVEVKPDFERGEVIIYISGQMTFRHDPQGARDVADMIVESVDPQTPSNTAYQIDADAEEIRDVAKAVETFSH